MLEFGMAFAPAGPLELDALELAPVELDALELAPAALIWPENGGQVCAHEPEQLLVFEVSFIKTYRVLPWLSVRKEPRVEFWATLSESAAEELLACGVAAGVAAPAELEELEELALDALELAAVVAVASGVAAAAEEEDDDDDEDADEDADDEADDEAVEVAAVVGDAAAVGAAAGALAFVVPLLRLCSWSDVGFWHCSIVKA